MARCSVCESEVGVTDACPHCACPTCDDHRQPGAHDCSGVRADRTTGWVIDLDARDTPRPLETGARVESDESAGGGGAVTATASGTGAGRLRDLLGPGKSLGVATGLLVVVVLLAATLSVGGPTGLDEERVERQIAREANAARQAAGSGTLSYNETLARVAGAHSRNMARGGYVSHKSPDGAGLAARYARFGLTCNGGENVYFSPQATLASSERALAELVVRSWLDSPGHRETLLKARFTRQGIGVVIAPKGRLYVTQDLC